MRAQIEPDFKTARKRYGEMSELRADEITQILWDKRGEK